MIETIPAVSPDARYQCCTVHFYQNIFSATPRNKMKTVVMMLKANHAQDNKKLKEMKINSATKKLLDGIENTLTHMNFLTQHWTRIQTTNAFERLNREISWQTKAFYAFPDGQSALMLV